VGPDDRLIDSTSQSLLSTCSIATLGVVTSRAARWQLRSRAASDDGGQEAALPQISGKESRGSTTAARACSSSRCFLFLIAKSFKDTLTFGLPAVMVKGGGDEYAGGARHPAGVLEPMRFGTAKPGDSTRLIGGGCTRRRGSEVSP